jgi:hypothetical protein
MQDTDVCRPIDQDIAAISRGKRIKKRARAIRTQKKKNRKRKRVSAKAWAGVTDPDAYTIREFCKRHMLSRPTYNRLRADGRGPRVIKLDQKVLITKEAAADWRAEHEARTAAQAAAE